jgi:hypothetical protein
MVVYSGFYESHEPHSRIAVANEMAIKVATCTEQIVA